MKQFLFIICFALFTTSTIAGSCPILWGEIDTQVENIQDSDIKPKIVELRDAGKKAHSEGNHSTSEQLLNKALKLLKS